MPSTRGSKRERPTTDDDTTTDTDSDTIAISPSRIFFCSAFIDYIKGRFEAIKDIYSPYQFKLHLSSLCCVIVPLNSLHHANSFSLAHEGSRWQLIT